MEPQAHNHAAPNKVTKPGRTMGVVQGEVPVRLDSTVLELASVLQTTLDLQQLISLFQREARRLIDIDGLRYRTAGESLSISLGEQALHQANYEIDLKSERLGQLTVYRQQLFREQDLTQLENLLCALVYPLRNALAYRTALERAFHDPLTGVQNRAAMDQALLRETELARRQETPLSAIVLDVDHFKRINDQHGHSFGDHVLKAVAHAVGDTIRRSDLLFRYGGEEFLVLASHTGNGGAQQLAERIRRSVAAHETVNGRALDLTVSLGVATLRPGENANQLFQRADAALYQAKASGRNRMVSA